MGKSEAGVEGHRSELLRLLGDFDGVGSRGLLAEAAEGCTVDALIADLILPTLHEVGERWASGAWTVAQEHFASGVVENLLQAMRREQEHPDGPLALLACPGGERHSLPLLCCAVLLQERGWRSAILGAETPLDEIDFAARATSPAAVVLAVNSPEPAELLSGSGPPGLGPAETAVWLGGGAANEEMAGRLHAALLPDDLLAAVERLTAAP